MIENKDKLHNFPTVNWITLEKSVDRKECMISQLDSLGLKHNMIEGYDGLTTDYTNSPIVSGDFFYQMNSPQIAISISHVKNIKNWFENTDENYGVFCEDDVLFETVNYWNFTWDDIINRLPENWQVVQLSLIKDNISEEDMKLNKRYNINWSAACYILTREYAKYFLSKYVEDNGHYSLRVPDGFVPYSENIIFFNEHHPLRLSLPLFTTANFQSVFTPLFFDDSYTNVHLKSSSFILNWWKTQADNKNQLDILFP